MGWINTDWETYLTAIYQTDSQTIKCIQHPFFKFKKQFLNFFTKSPYCNVHLHPIIHITTVEIPGVASRSEMPQGGKRQQQNNMLRKDS